MKKPVKLTRTQGTVAHALCRIRGVDNTRSLKGEFAKIEETTAQIRRENNDPKQGKISRQLWTEPFSKNETGKGWKMLGQAVRGELSHQHPIEIFIRRFRADPAVELAQKEGELNQAQKIATDLQAQFEIASKERDDAKTALDEYKSKFRADQCTDAHFKVNYQRVIGDNEKKTEEINAQKDITRGLKIENTNLVGRINELEAQLRDLSGDQLKNVVPLKKPDFIEPEIVGSEKDIDTDDLLIKYEDAVDDALEKLKKLVRKKKQPSITIVFHTFNESIENLYKDQLIPLLSSSADNIVFGVCSFDKDLRQRVYGEARILTKSDPLIVHVSGAKVSCLPPPNRTSQSDHERFVALARGGYPARQTRFNPENEGYDTVVFRRLGVEY